MRAGSLFSGCGLADYGLHQAGFELAWACEIEKQPRAVLRRHFPKAEIHFDVKEMTGGTLEPVDLLFFGSPCQDLSVAGKRAGLAGERSGLFAEAMRIVDEMDAPPRICVWENVCGALSSNKGADFATVLTEMGKRWSGVAYRVFDLQWFGVPQRRRRVFVVGHSGGWRSAAEILFEREGLRRNPPTRRKAGQGVAGGVAGSLGAGDGNRGWRNDLDQGAFIPCRVESEAVVPVDCRGVSPTITSKMQGSSGWAPYNETEHLVPCRMAAFGEYVADGSASTLKRRDYKDATDLVVSPAVIPLKEPCKCLSAAGSVKNALHGDPGDPSFTLNANWPQGVAVAIQDIRGFDKKQNGKGWNDDGTAYTVDAMATQGVDICARESGQGYWMEDDKAGTLRAEGENRPSRPSHVVAFTTRGRADGLSVEFQEDLAYALKNPGNGGRSNDRMIAHAMQVRRLTCVECERLMGAPDGYTAWGIDDNGNRVEMADGPRYKMIGNGVGVPHSRWIGNRIVDQSK